MSKTFKNFSVRGFKAGGISAGIKKNGKKDLALIVSEVPARVAGVFTKNSVKAASVTIDAERVKIGFSYGVIVNSGNANACNGKKGAVDALTVLGAAEKALGLKKGGLLISQTGVIGELLPASKITSALPALVKKISPAGWSDAAEAIMTTDAFPKAAYGRVKISGSTVNILGIAKGAGMICPDMATMLCFFVTDAAITSAALKKTLVSAVDSSFNRITVDNDASTNDTVLLFANGLSGCKPVECGSADFKTFTLKLSAMAVELARMIVKDGEGATKVIEIEVKNAKTDKDAAKAARKIAASPLVKTAFFGADPNWGRIMAALGSSGARFDADRVEISFNGVKVVKNGAGTGAEEKAKKTMKEKEVKVAINLNAGKKGYKLWTCDLTHDYVTINSAYRS